MLVMSVAITSYMTHMLNIVSSTLVGSWTQVIIIVSSTLLVPLFFFYLILCTFSIFLYLYIIYLPFKKKCNSIFYKYLGTCRLLHNYLHPNVVGVVNKIWPSCFSSSIVHLSPPLPLSLSCSNKKKNCKLTPIQATRR
jgi:hypothetical protein